VSVRRFLRLLPDSLVKHPESNIGKLFTIFEKQFTDLQIVLGRSEKWRSVDRAKGSTLDHLGDNVNVSRGGADDDLYRLLIRGKIIRSRSDGTVNQIIKALSVTLGCEQKDMHIENAVLDQEGNRYPATIQITAIPEDKLSEVQISTAVFMRLVNEVVAGGVGVRYDLETTIPYKSTCTATAITSDYQQTHIPAQIFGDRDFEIDSHASSNILIDFKQIKLQGGNVNV